MKFHWNTIGAQSHPSGDPLSLERELGICLVAEKYGFDSVQLPLSDDAPDPLLLSLTLSRRTQKLRFMVSCRPDRISPAYFVQQINTLSSLIDGRVHVRIVSESADAAHERSIEFVSVCQAFWSRSGPVNHSGTHYRVAEGKIKTPFVSSVRQTPEIFLDGDLLRLPFENSAEAILAHAASGVREFVIEGRGAKELEHFGRKVLPLVRHTELQPCD